MKRSEALYLIANQIDFIKGKFQGYRTNFSNAELSEADVILTNIEAIGMLPPGRDLFKDRTSMWNDVYVSHTWEPEE